VHPGSGNMPKLMAQQGNHSSEGVDPVGGCPSDIKAQTLQNWSQSLKGPMVLENRVFVSATQQGRQVQVQDLLVGLRLPVETKGPAGRGGIVDDAEWLASSDPAPPTGQRFSERAERWVAQDLLGEEGAEVGARAGDRQGSALRQPNRPSGIEQLPAERLLVPVCYLRL